MKRLLLLLPLLCLFNARPLFAVDWAVWLSDVYCQAREAGLNHSLLLSSQPIQPHSPALRTQIFR